MARRCKTFSIGFDEKEFDELPYARLVAERYGTDHHEFVVGPDAVDLLPQLSISSERAAWPRRRRLVEHPPHERHLVLAALPAADPAARRAQTPAPAPEPLVDRRAEPFFRAELQRGQRRRASCGNRNSCGRC